MSNKIIFALIIILGINNLVYAQQYYLDSTYNTDGYSKLPIIIPPYLDTKHLLVLPDESCFFTGKAESTSPGKRILLGSTTPEGNYNPSFNTNGFLSTNFSDFDEFATKSISLPDGSFITTGWTESPTQNFATSWRTNSAGELITSFGTGGFSIINNIQSSLFSDIILDPTQDEFYFQAGIFYGEQNESNQLFIAKYNFDGQLDSNFGNNGIYIFSNTESSYQEGKLVVTPENKLLFVGLDFVQTTSSTRLLIAQINLNGSLDTNYGTNGKTYINGFPAYKFLTPYSVELDHQNQLVIGGAATTGTTKFSVALRVFPNGILDTSFGDNGFSVFEFDKYQDFGSPTLKTFAIPIDGKTILITTEFEYFWVVFPLTILVLNEDGSPDVAVGDEGIVKFEIPELVQLKSVQKTPDNSIWILGEYANYLNNGFSKYDPIIIKLNTPYTTSSTEIIHHSEPLTIYPNPANKTITVSLPVTAKHGAYNFSIYDNLGKERFIVSPQIIKSTELIQVQINLPNSLSSGTYTLIGKSKNQQFSAKLMITH